jgi:hypothetical protein
METLLTFSDITENSDPFRDLVVRDLKYRHEDRISSAERAPLREPGNLRLWLDALVHLRREMEAQFAERRGEEFREAWRRNHPQEEGEDREQDRRKRGRPS